MLQAFFFNSTKQIIPAKSFSVPDLQLLTPQRVRVRINDKATSVHRPLQHLEHTHRETAFYCNQCCTKPPHKTPVANRPNMAIRTVRNPRNVFWVYICRDP